MITMANANSSPWANRDVTVALAEATSTYLIETERAVGGDRIDPCHQRQRTRRCESKENPRLGLRGITGGMFQTHSWLNPNYYYSGISSWWAAGEAGQYGNPISEYIGDHILRPLLGDHLLSTGDISSIDWINLWAMPTRFAAGAVQDLVQNLREMTFDPMLREAFILGLVVRGDPVEADRQQTAFALAMTVESSYSPLNWFFGLTSEVGELIYEFGGVDARESFDLGKMAREYGQELSAGAYADGQKATVLLDIAGDIAIEVFTAGAATPVIAARRAAKVGASVGSKAARMVAKHVDDAAGAVKTAARHADDLPRGRRALLGKTPHGGSGASAAAPIANQLRRPEALLNRLHDLTERGLSRIIHGWLGNTKLHNPLASLSNRLGFKACFTAGTPLLVPGGSQMIEDLRPGDLVLSKNEFDATSDVAPKVIEEIFVREALVWHLHVGGQTIRTTAEHPFWVEGQGWLAVNLLQPGMRLQSHDGRWELLDGVRDTGTWERVYNLRVADWHTYFAGCAEWGFGLWAHNLNYSKIGNVAEHTVVDVLKSKGWTIIGPIKRGTHGIDIIATKIGPNGQKIVRIFEVKANSSRLSKLQQLGADGYAQNVLRRFGGSGNKNLSPATRAAMKVLEDEIAAGRKIRGVAIKLDWVSNPGTLVTKVRRWVPNMKGF